MNIVGTHTDKKYGTLLKIELTRTDKVEWTKLVEVRGEKLNIDKK